MSTLLEDSKQAEFQKILTSNSQKQVPVIWTPRQIEWFKAEFGLDYLVQDLKAALTSFSSKNAESSATAAINKTHLQHVLSLTAALIIDLEVSQYLYSSKIHKILDTVTINLSAENEDEEESSLGDAVEAILSHLLESGSGSGSGSGGGSSSAGASNSLPIVTPLLTYTFRNNMVPGGEGEVTTSKLHLRKVNDAMYGHGQFSVGYIMWPSALILSAWIFRNRTIFYGKNVLELGSGLGLSGIAAGGFAKSIILSDFNDRVLETLNWNLSLNTYIHPSTAGEGYEGDADDAGHIALDGHFEHIDSANADAKVCHFDWNIVLEDSPCSVQPFSFYRSKDVGVHGIVHRLQLPSQIANSYECSSCLKQHWTPEILSTSENPHIRADTTTVAVHYSKKFPCVSSKDEKAFDIIIGSDLICCDRDAILLTNVIRRMLSPIGIAIIVLAQPQHRYGVELFIPSLLSSGFEVYWRPIISKSAVSQYAKSFPEDHSVFAGTYFGCESSSNWAEFIDRGAKEEESGINSSSSGGNASATATFFEINEELLHGVEERQHQGWDLVVCRLKQS